MESELEALRRTNAELQAWVRDLLQENRYLRSLVAAPGEPRTAAGETTRQARGRLET